MILVIDNYDSFTYNLVHYVNELGAETVVHRNDKISVQDALAMAPEAVLLSPGPCTPDEAGVCLPLLRGAPADLAILGVCLGHQAIGRMVILPSLSRTMISGLEPESWKSPKFR